MISGAKRESRSRCRIWLCASIASMAMISAGMPSVALAQGPLGPPIGGGIPRTVPKPKPKAVPRIEDQPALPPRVPQKPSGSLGQPFGSPINPIDQRGSLFGEGEDSHGIEMSLWPEDMEVINGLLQWRVNIVRFSPLVSSNYRTPVRPDGFITGVGQVAATFSQNQDGTCTSVLSIAGKPKTTIRIDCSRGPGLMFRVLKPPRQTRWIVLNAVYRETEGAPTVVREYLADMRTGEVTQISDFTAEGFVIYECENEAKVLWNSESARRLGLRVKQCISTPQWPSDDGRLAGRTSADQLPPRRITPNPTPRPNPAPKPEPVIAPAEETTEWIRTYRDSYLSGEVSTTATAVARVRDLPTSDGSRVLRTLSQGDAANGRWVRGRDPAARWLKLSDTNGYVWEGNLGEEGATTNSNSLDVKKWLNTDIREWGWLLADFLVEHGASEAKSAAVRTYFYELIHKLPPNLIGNLNSGAFKQSLLNELRPQGIGASLASAAEGIIFDKIKTVVIVSAKSELKIRYGPELAEAMEYVINVSADTALGFVTGGGAPGAYAAFAKSVTLNTLVKTTEVAQSYYALHKEDKNLQDIWINEGQSIIKLMAVSKINRGIGRLELSNRQLSTALSIQQDTLIQLQGTRTYSNQWIIISKLIDSKNLEIKGDISGSQKAVTEAKKQAEEFNKYRWTDLVHPVNYLTLFDKAASAFAIRYSP